MRTAGYKYAFEDSNWLRRQQQEGAARQVQCRLRMHTQLSQQVQEPLCSTELQDCPSNEFTRSFCATVCLSVSHADHLDCIQAPPISMSEYKAIVTGATGIQVRGSRTELQPTVTSLRERTDYCHRSGRCHTTHPGCTRARWPLRCNRMPVMHIEAKCAVCN